MGRLIVDIRQDDPRIFLSISQTPKIIGIVQHDRQQTRKKNPRETADDRVKAKIHRDVECTIFAQNQQKTAKLNDLRYLSIVAERVINHPNAA